MSRPGDGSVQDDCESVEYTQRTEKWIGNGKGTKDGNGKGKGKGKGNGKVKGIVKRTPGGDDVSCAVGSQLQKQMSEADLGKEA
jgi:hypothetical protein